jgi:hypothetical protein
LALLPRNNTGTQSSLQFINADFFTLKIFQGQIIIGSAIFSTILCAFLQPETNSAGISQREVPTQDHLPK